MKRRADDLTRIQGLGKGSQQLLNRAGIWSFADLAKRFGCSPASVSKRARVQGWNERRARVREKLGERREAAAAAVPEGELAGRTELRRALDHLLRQTATAILAGEFKVSTPAELERVLRLSDHLEGEAQAEAEARRTISLEDLERRRKEVAAKSRGLERLGEAGRGGVPIAMPSRAERAREEEEASG